MSTVTCTRCGVECQGERGPVLALLDHAREAHQREPGVEYSPYAWPHVHRETEPRVRVTLPLRRRYARRTA